MLRALRLTSWLTVLSLASLGACQPDETLPSDAAVDAASVDVFPTDVPRTDTSTADAALDASSADTSTPDASAPDASADSGGDSSTPAEPLYTQIGTDPTWQYILDEELIPIGENSTDGIEGSTIDVNNALVEQGPYAEREIIDDIRIHTVGNSAIRRADFDRWSRWYQEDGNTQVFRLFEGEHNVRNDRPNASRIEAHSPISWAEGDGWHEWVGHYTVVEPGDGFTIFQAKNNINDWSVSINLTDEGDIVMNRRVGDDETIARNMTGRGFDLRVRDNGLDYEVFLDGEMMGTGSYERPEGETRFRWGMYVGGHRNPTGPMMLFVTGATVDP